MHLHEVSYVATLTTGAQESSAARDVPSELYVLRASELVRRCEHHTEIAWFVVLLKSRLGETVGLAVPALVEVVHGCGKQHR